VRPLRSAVHPQRRLRLPAFGDVRRRPHRAALDGGPLVSGVHSGGFFERNIAGLHAAMERALFAETTAESGGLLQRLDARVKLAGLFALIAAAAVSARLSVVAALLLLAAGLGLASRISLRTL